MNPNELKRRFPRASDAFLDANSDRVEGLRSAVKKHTQGMPLERAAKGKGSSLPRFAICFTIYAVRPPDWDNPWIKTVQDALRAAGILHDDAWNVLQGSVVCEKVDRKEDERTEIEIKPVSASLNKL